METYTKADLVRFAEWFNKTQWRGGKGDPIKALFCKCDYPAIVEQGLKELEITGSDDAPDVNERGIQ